MGVLQQGHDGGDADGGIDDAHAHVVLEPYGDGNAWQWKRYVLLL